MIGIAKKRIIATNYNEQIDIYIKEAAQAWEDNPADVLVDTILASVHEITGYMMLQYEKQGINRPVTIECNYINYLPSKIIWRGREITVSSIIDADEQFKRRTRILGSFTKQV